MNNSVNIAVFHEEFVQFFSSSEIEYLKLRLCSGYLTDTVGNSCFRVGEVVNQNNLKTFVHKFHGRMRSDIAGSSGNNNSFFHYRLQ